MHTYVRYADVMRESEEGLRERSEISSGTSTKNAWCCVLLWAGQGSRPRDPLMRFE